MKKMRVSEKKRVDLNERYVTGTFYMFSVNFPFL